MSLDWRWITSNGGSLLSLFHVCIYYFWRADGTFDFPSHTPRQDGSRRLFLVQTFLWPWTLTRIRGKRMIDAHHLLLYIHTQSFFSLVWLINFSTALKRLRLPTVEYVAWRFQQYYGHMPLLGLVIGPLVNEIVYAFQSMVEEVSIEYLFFFLFDVPPS